MSKIPIYDGGRMWREVAIIINRGIKNLISTNKLSKKWVIHADAGNEVDEGEKKIGPNPQRPLSYGEFLSYFHAIKSHSESTYIDTIRNLLQDDDICLKQKNIE